MVHRNFQEMFLAAGMPEDQVDNVLDHFHAVGEAADIISVAEYETAKSIHEVMDASVPSGDLHSPVARYLISLGARIAAWEDQNIQRPL
ncbi:hypothetical protein E4191_15890 (plasmid) [Paracoccus liaowanqingii]|uniref:Uncharacterized protein n=1 Tax=Paracoccus liaowanqingii TaxID=2560053 RepID=A0A4Y5SS76_9RHOB|nr:hypothetical protein [Paracoccus liaowanqingii]QDA35655.1 hypothetical protein E4191_15890 [Paracoccus liaowanqingii]